MLLTPALCGCRSLPLPPPALPAAHPHRCRWLPHGTQCRINKRATLSARELQTAARLVLPGALAKHAVSEGNKAVARLGLQRPVRGPEQASGG